jgi:hypothetical protein
MIGGEKGLPTQQQWSGRGVDTSVGSRSWGRCVVDLTITL